MSQLLVAAMNNTAKSIFISNSETASNRAAITSPRVVVTQLSKMNQGGPSAV
jgi:hypothetical protein